VIEDCAQALLAARDGRLAGTIGSCGIFSFQSSKHVPAGDGGALVTNDAALRRECMALREHGWDVLGGPSSLGWNYRLTELTAAIVLARFESVGAIIDHHERAGAALDAAARRSGLVTPQHVPSQCRHTYSRWAALLPSGLDAAAIARRLTSARSRFKLERWGPAYLRPLFQEDAARRGYGPIASTMAHFRLGLCPVAESIVPRLLVMNVSSQLSLDAHLAELAKVTPLIEGARDDAGV
jgi:dTDP-4-amino-4,6-dideoxygalactose transaminase